MTDPAPPSPPPIDYAPPGKRRGWWKKYLVGALIFLAAAALIYEWPAVQRYHAISQSYMWQRRAMNFTLPRNTIVYSDKPTEIQKLRANRNYFSPGRNDPVFYNATPLREMMNWRRQYGGAPPIKRDPSGGVFLHSRTRPDGQKRLVAIAAFPFDPPNGSPRYLILRIQVMRPGNLTRLWMPGGIALVNLPLQPTDRITLFAGQPDPFDASHFTIDYVLNDDSGTIDGWLRADGTVDLRPRQGVITSHPAGAPAMI